MSVFAGSAKSEIQLAPFLALSRSIPLIEFRPIGFVWHLRSNHEVGFTGLHARSSCKKRWRLLFPVHARAASYPASPDHFDFASAEMRTESARILPDSLAREYDLLRTVSLRQAHAKH